MHGEAVNTCLDLLRHAWNGKLFPEDGLLSCALLQPHQGCSSCDVQMMPMQSVDFAQEEQVGLRTPISYCMTGQQTKSPW